MPFALIEIRQLLLRVQHGYIVDANPHEWSTTTQLLPYHRTNFNNWRSSHYTDNSHKFQFTTQLNDSQFLRLNHPQ